MNSQGIEQYFGYCTGHRTLPSLPRTLGLPGKFLAFQHVIGEGVALGSKSGRYYEGVHAVPHLSRPNKKATVLRGF